MTLKFSWRAVRPTLLQSTCALTASQFNQTQLRGATFIRLEILVAERPIARMSFVRVPYGVRYSGYLNWETGLMWGGTRETRMMTRLAGAKSRRASRIRSRQSFSVVTSQTAEIMSVGESPDRVA